MQSDPEKSDGPHGPAPGMETLDAPGMLARAGSATKAMGQFAASGFQTVSKQVHAARVAKCEACDYHHDGKLCRLCGCFTDLKARLPLEDCPIGKWPA